MFFVDEAHLMRTFEPWYEPLESLQVIQGAGGYAWIPDTTFVFATSKISKLPKPLRDRFGLKLRVEPYSVEDLASIISQRTSIKGADAIEIAQRSRGVARLAINLAHSVERAGMGVFDMLEIDSKA